MFVGTLSLCVVGQDLGTSNKLFGKNPDTAKAKRPTMHRNVSASAAKRQPKSARKTSSNLKTPVRIAPRTSERPAIGDTRTPIRIAPRITVPAIKDQEVKTSPPLDRAQNEAFERLLGDGRNARNSHGFLAAEIAYRRARDINGSDPRPVILLGAIYVETHRWEDAEKAYRAVLRLDPRNVDAYTSLSFVLTQPLSAPGLSDRYAEAEQMARTAITIRAENAEAYDQLGVALERQGLIGSETENAYRRAIKIDGGYAPAYAHLGRLMRRRGRNADAESSNLQAVTRANDVRSMVLVADSMQSEQRFEASIAVLKKALDRDPRDPSALFLIGKALTSTGKFEAAETFLIRSSEVAPASFVGYSLLGTLYVQQGKYEIGENWLLQAGKVAGAFEKLELAGQFESLGDAYSRSKKSAAAERAFRKALSLDDTRTTIAAKIAGVRR